MVDIVLVLRYEASVCFWVEARSVFAQIVIASWNQSYVQVICEHVQFLLVLKIEKTYIWNLSPFWFHLASYVKIKAGHKCRILMSCWFIRVDAATYVLEEKKNYWLQKV